MDQEDNLSCAQEAGVLDQHLLVQGSHKTPLSKSPQDDLGGNTICEGRVATMQYLKLKLDLLLAKQDTWWEEALYTVFLIKETADFTYFLINFYWSIVDLQCCVFIYSFGKHVVQGLQTFRNRSVYKLVSI